MSKEKLIAGLKLAITSLTNDTIKYDWTKFKHCNCGVVARTTLKYDNDTFKELVNAPFEAIREEEDVEGLTWKNVVQSYCSVTGLSNFRVFRELEAAGMTNVDMVHLEYLSDPEILAASGIKKVDITKKVLKGTKTVMVKESYNSPIKKVVQVDEIIKVPSTSFFGKLFGWSTSKTVKVNKEIDSYVVLTREVPKEEEIYETQVTGQKYPDNYYMEKKNLILYLKAWVQILENANKWKEELREVVNKATIEHDDIKLKINLEEALEKEDYIRAATIRYMLNNKPQ